MKKITLSFVFLLSMAMVFATMAENNINRQSKQQKETSEKKETKIKNNNKIETKKMGTIHLTKDDFLKKVTDYENNPNEWKYLGDKPCIIDFYADWCAPCKMVAPILEDLAKEYADQIYIYKINTEQEQELAAVFGIRSIPTLLFVPMNEAPQMAQGALPKNAFKEAIESILLKKEKLTEDKK